MLGNILPECTAERAAVMGTLPTGDIERTVLLHLEALAGGTPQGTFISFDILSSAAVHTQPLTRCTVVTQTTIPTVNDLVAVVAVIEINLAVVPGVV